MSSSFDWSDPRHWRDGRARRCIYCNGWTPLLDGAGRPAHKTFAEHCADLIRSRRKETS